MGKQYTDKIRFDVYCFADATTLPRKNCAQKLDNYICIKNFFTLDSYAFTVCILIRMKSRLIEKTTRVVRVLIKFI